MYYLRTKPKAQALKGLGVDMSNIQPIKEVETLPELEPMKEFNGEEFLGKVCSLNDPNCESCGA